MQCVNKKLQRLKAGLECRNPQENTREKLLRKRRELQKMMHQIPSKDHFDPDFRRLKYVRYADDFIVGVIGSRKEAESIMLQLKEFVEKELLLELAEDKTCIKKATEGVKFLGYDVKVNSSKPKVLKMVMGNGTCVTRTTNEVMQLHVPAEKVYQYSGKNGYGNIAQFRATSRARLLQRSDLEILLAYNAEMRGFTNYYALAQGYKKSLCALIGSGGLSLFATLANKHHSCISKIAARMRLPDQQGYGLRVTINGKPKVYKLFQLKDHVLPKAVSNEIDQPWNTGWLTTPRTELIQRLNANRCEYCGKEGGYMEVHL
jgi:RNA-directed DNA polymerase